MGVVATMPSSDLLRDIASKDPMFDIVLKFVDELPKTYNTVDIAKSQVGKSVDIDVVGNITVVHDATPVQITKQNYDDGTATYLFDKTHVFFEMAGEAFTLLCAVHNVPSDQVRTFPYGKSEEEYERVIQNLQYAWKYGCKVQVRGRYVSVTSNRKQERVIYADTVNVEDSALVSKMQKSKFERFMMQCDKYYWDKVDVCPNCSGKSKVCATCGGTGKVSTPQVGITPLRLFMNEIFINFRADEYLMKTIALFCLSPKSREEMMHIMLFSSPGEGKDYLIDKIIRPMVKCGKVDTETTAPSLVGAMSSDNLSSIGVGVLQKYHNERLAASEVQTWDVQKMRALLGVLANGYVSVSKGKMQDITRPATENILLAGNISNSWKEGTTKMAKMDSILSGKNKQFARQMLSRMTFVYAKTSLIKNQDDREIAKIMFKNLDQNAAIREEELFGRDDCIKRYCADTKLSPEVKSQMIRERKIELLINAGLKPEAIVKMLKQRAYQEFFGQYFKYVSTNLRICAMDAFDGVYRSLKALSSRPNFKDILCNESGDLDKRKIQEYANVCLSFAKVNGHDSIKASDIAEAENLLMQSLETLIDNFGVGLLTFGLDMVELEMLKFIGDNGSATEDEIRTYIRAESSDEFFEKNLCNLKPYLHLISGKYVVNFEKVPEEIRNELGIKPADSIVEKENLANRPRLGDDEINARLGTLDIGGDGDA